MTAAYIKRDIMKLAYNHPVAYRDGKCPVGLRLLVSNIMQFENGITATQYSAVAGVTIFNASAQMRIGFEKGWLQRVETTMLKGGVVFVYSCNPEKWGTLK